MKKYRLQLTFMDGRHAIPYTEAVHRVYMLERCAKVAGRLAARR
jgi:hypothetical protein